MQIDTAAKASKGLPLEGSCSLPLLRRIVGSLRRNTSSVLPVSPLPGPSWAQPRRDAVAELPESNKFAGRLFELGLDITEGHFSQN